MRGLIPCVMTRQKSGCRASPRTHEIRPPVYSTLRPRRSVFPRSASDFSLRIRYSITVKLPNASHPRARRRTRIPFALTAERSRSCLSSNIYIPPALLFKSVTIESFENRCSEKNYRESLAPRAADSYELCCPTAASRGAESTVTLISLD